MTTPQSKGQPATEDAAKTGLVSKRDLEKLLAQLQTNVTDPNVGLFGPESLVWHVNREALVFLAGGRAALLQLAHPLCRKRH